MSTRTHSPQRLSRVSAALALGALMAVAKPACADQVELGSSSHHDAVFLQSSDLRLTDFRSPVAGTLTVQLKEIPWQELLQSVSVTVSRLGSIVATYASAGTFTFEIGKGETLSLGIYAVTRSTSRHGLYTLDASFVPRAATEVPVPAAGWLLASGAALLGGLRRRIRPVALGR